MKVSTGSDFLDKMLVLKKEEVAGLRGCAEARKAGEAEARHPRGHFLRALRREGMSVIAEIKRASPSVGSIRAEVDLPGRARAYEAGGASAISVLTESRYFGGSLDDLAQAASLVEIPVLRKDFILDAVQIDLAVLHGASAVLLIVAFVDVVTLRALLKHARGRGLDALVEVHGVEEIEVAMEAGAEILGVNARNLRTLKVDLEHTWEMGRVLMEMADPPLVRIAESGIKTGFDAQKAWSCGFGACLVGEALMREEEPGPLIAELRAHGVA